MRALINTILGRPAPGFKIQMNENGYYRAFHPQLDTYFWFLQEGTKPFRAAVRNSWLGYEALKKVNEEIAKRGGEWKEIQSPKNK